MEKGFKRKLTAILSADVAGYSRLMSEDEVRTVRTLQDYRKAISDLVQKHDGRVVDSPGDNLLAEFASVVDSVQCAMDIQEVLHAKNNELPENRRMQFRIGINLGDVISEDGRIYGDGVNIAARVESFAEAGGICISGTAYEHILNKLALKYEDLGEHQVKNIQKPIRVYKIPIKPKESLFDSVVDLAVPTDKASIAVLPFVNMSGDPEQEYFSDGMTEEVITALSKVPDILVIARNSTFIYKGKAVNIKLVGKELGVKYILEGSVRKAGNKIRLTAQLIDAETGNHLWAERYDRDLKDIFELQDEITTRILEQLYVRISHDVKARLSAKGTDNLEAYLTYLQGIKHRTLFNKKDNHQARKLFMEAIKLDPNWGAAYSALGFVNLLDYYGGWSSSPENCIQETLDCLKKALSVDNTSPESYYLLSSVDLIKKRYDEAITEAEKAILLQPNFHTGYQALGHALTLSGYPQKAQEMFKKAIRLSPGNSMLIYNLGQAYFDSGQYNETISILKKSLEINSESIFALVLLTAAYSLANRDDEARKQAEEVLRIEPNFSAENFADRVPYKNQSDTDRILDALRKAGLK